MRTYFNCTGTQVNASICVIIITQCMSVTSQIYMASTCIFNNDVLTYVRYLIIERNLTMKRLLLVILIVIVMGALPAFAADVGVSVSIGQPGFYGRIDIGNVPRPELVYPEPIVIQPVPRGRVIQPLYLRVPPGHQKHWAKHCREYNACGQPVYFVKENWYNNVYVPHYKQHGDKGGRREGNRGKGHKDRGRGRDRD